MSLPYTIKAADDTVLCRGRVQVPNRARAYARRPLSLLERLQAVVARRLDVEPGEIFTAHVGRRTFKLKVTKNGTVRRIPRGRPKPRSA